MSTNGHAQKKDVLVRRLSSISGSDTKQARVLDDELDKSIYERFFKPMIRSFSSAVSRIMPSGGSGSAGNPKIQKTRKMLGQAGLSLSVEEFNMVRLMILASVALGLALLAALLHLGAGIVLLAFIFGLYGGYAVIRFYLTKSISNRRKQMEAQLPDVLDLLSINVEAGLGFEQAIKHVTEKLRGPLVDEMTVTYREIAMGRSRRDAFTLLGERCDLDMIRSFTSSIIQAGQLGISIKNVLRSQSASIRLARRNKIEEQAMKLSVKILIPMVTLIFPVIFIVLMGPAAIKIMEVFS